MINYSVFPNLEIMKMCVAALFRLKRTNTMSTVSCISKYGTCAASISHKNRLKKVLNKSVKHKRSQTKWLDYTLEKLSNWRRVELFINLLKEQTQIANEQCGLQLKCNYAAFCRILLQVCYFGSLVYFFLTASTHLSEHYPRWIFYKSLKWV